MATTTTQIVIRGLNPEPWTSPEVGIGRRNGKPYPRFYSNEQMKNYKAAVQSETEAQLPPGWEPCDENVSLTLYFWRALEPYQTPQARRSRKHEADATNLQKATEDALQGVLFTNDKNVIHVESWIMEQEHHTEPLIVIEMTANPHRPAMTLEETEEPIRNDRDPHADLRAETAEEFFG